ncbi:MAG: hypothetical protein U0003_04190 [Vampirovibrionales bacterium]
MTHPAGEAITINSDFSLNVPDCPIIRIGKGTCRVDLWPATQHVLDSAVQAACDGKQNCLARNLWPVKKPSIKPVNGCPKPAWMPLLNTK